MKIASIALAAVLLAASLVHAGGYAPAGQLRQRQFAPGACAAGGLGGCGVPAQQLAPVGGYAVQQQFSAAVYQPQLLAAPQFAPAYGVGYAPAFAPRAVIRQRPLFQLNVGRGPVFRQRAFGFGY